MTRTRTTIYVTLLSVVLALALTAALAACGSDEPPGGTGPDRTASPPADTPASPTRTPTMPVSGVAPTATDAPGPAASGSAETDRQALVALYYATDGKSWYDSDNWLSDAPLGEWYGVTTYDDGRVTGLYLYNNGLNWLLPPELGSLSNLERLYLNDNELIEEIPAELGSLSNLERLYLNDNYLSGEIPPELGSLSNLVELVLSYDELSGEIPPELGSLSNLTELVLNDNVLSGCVPSSLEDQLDLDNSDLGDLPFC